MFAARKKLLSLRFLVLFTPCRSQKIMTTTSNTVTQMSSVDYNALSREITAKNSLSLNQLPSSQMKTEMSTSILSGRSSSHWQIRSNRKCRVRRWIVIRNVFRNWRSRIRVKMDNYHRLWKDLNAVLNKNINKYTAYFSKFDKKECRIAWTDLLSSLKKERSLRHW